MQKEDPQGPVILIQTFDPGPDRPSDRFSLQCPGLKISRTYSLSGELNRYAASGVTIYNHVFTDTPSRESLSDWKIETTSPDEPVPWRRGYYDKPRSWEKSGPSPGDQNQVTRRFSSQKDFQCQDMPAPKKTLEERLSAKARSLSKAASKWRRKRAQHEDTDSDSSSSSSSDSASSSDAPAGPSSAH
eukprot:Skav233667  [mRNA]  locus=scaffold976:120683:121243:- [translate_table: standard]